MDPIVLSFHDSLLRQSDVQLLDGSNWLNDKIIGFYFEYGTPFLQPLHESCPVHLPHRYLEYVVFREFSDRVCFVTPDVTQFIKLYEGSRLSLSVCIS